MEEGEILPHDPSLEWPGERAFGSSGPSTSSSRPKRICTFRLLVQHSLILPKSQKIAVVDGYSELQFGRDKAPPSSNTPRLRLKEMEVSKLHATAYWDKSRSEWTLIDMGSKHGTFHTTNDNWFSITGTNSRGIRLSPPRVASMPRRLRHLDHVAIGSTTFIIHLHSDGLPCESCSLGDGEEIPLFEAPVKQDDVRKRKRGEEEETGPILKVEKDPKKAMNLLKQNLLSRRGPAITDDAGDKNWVDRSALRRALHPSREPMQSRVATPSSIPEPPQTAAPIEIQSTAPPITSSNIGHRLLEKQGWTPGTSLGQATEGDESTHRVEPISVNYNFGRSGLGSTPADVPQSTSIDWKEDGKRRRWSKMIV